MNRASLNTMLIKTSCFFLCYPRIKLLLVAPVQFADLTCACPGLRLCSDVLMKLASRHTPTVVFLLRGDMVVQTDSFSLSNQDFAFMVI